LPWHWGSSPRFSPPADGKKQQNKQRRIRAGIMQHLTRVGTLNMSAMVMDIRTVSITAIRRTPKLNSGQDRRAPGGWHAGCYNLEKRDGAWSFSKRRLVAA